MSELKKIDFDILNELSQNSRQSFRSLAKKIGVSVSTVIKRVENMQKDGVIKQFTVAIDHHKLGYDYHALVEIATVQERLNEVEEFLKKRREVYAIYDITGSKDVAILVRAKTQEEIRAFMRTLVEQPGIERTETRIIFDSLKEEPNQF